MECGIGQAEDIINIFNSSQKYLDIKVFSDINGVDRIIKVVKK